MESHFYTSERNAQIVIALLKNHGIRKVIASPGTTNICLIASMQQDPYFEIYSAADERSAGYIACGMAAESGEPVVISCTGATASRNYMPALTEAFYRKLPVLAITSSRRNYRIGHNFDQVTDRTQLPKDVAKLSVQVPLVYDHESEWADIIAVNKAILELTHRGNGPVHINLETNYSRDYSVKEIPAVRIIKRIEYGMEFPKISYNRVAIMVGAHVAWSKELTECVDRFCETNNGVVLCDHTSNYKGRYRIFANLASIQKQYKPSFKKADLVIHIGDVSASNYNIETENVWRVNPDGELRDPYGKLRYVFEMKEENFFAHYVSSKRNLEFFNACKEECELISNTLREKIDELPFSNAWAASQTAHKLPDNSAIHFGIQNSLRFWNYFDVKKSVLGYCNTGGFGIDGNMSSTIGAALADPKKIFYCVLGDLAFFYDMNSLGNKHLPNNIRILLVNNGKGTEFKLSGNPGYLFGDEADKYIAAAGHYGNKSRDLVKHYSEDLGFEYLSATSKGEYLKLVDHFTTSERLEKPILIEIFTESFNEDAALTLIRNTVVDEAIAAANRGKSVVKNLLGDKNTQIVKKLLRKK